MRWWRMILSPLSHARVPPEGASVCLQSEGERERGSLLYSTRRHFPWGKYIDRLMALWGILSTGREAYVTVKVSPCADDRTEQMCADVLYPAKFFSPFLIILSCGRGNGWMKISPPTPHTCSHSLTNFRERESECVQKGCGTCGHYGECWIGQVYTALGDMVSLRLRPYLISRNGTPIYLTTPQLYFSYF